MYQTYTNLSERIHERRGGAAVEARRRLRLRFFSEVCGRNRDDTASGGGDARGGRGEALAVRTQGTVRPSLRPPTRPAASFLRTASIRLADRSALTRWFRSGDCSLIVGSYRPRSTGLANHNAVSAGPEADFLKNPMILTRLFWLPSVGVSRRGDSTGFHCSDFKNGDASKD